jgi:two-component system response regulator HydG
MLAAYRLACEPRFVCCYCWDTLVGLGHILVIDDYFSDRLLFRRILSGMGHEVAEANNGEEGLEQAKAKAIDLVLLDFKMPGMNGIETLRQLKSANPLIPVVLVTASHEADSAIEAMRLGAFEYLTKPVEVVHLQQVVSSAAYERAGGY